ncbi:MAG: hypothetical protein ABEJ34_03090 [Haloferacaceae archaeon]
MSVVPGSIDAGRGPPLAVPLWHFAAACGFLLAALGVGLAEALGVAPGLASVARRHLLLTGWVCLTIMGAMTQFIPVWSGVALHSRRLATAQAWLAAVGVAGMAAGFLLGWLTLVPAFGALAVLGFWTFVYNVGRTLARAGSLDVTERHFALALGFFVLLTLLALALAVDLVAPVLAARPAVVGAHVTLAVLGAVLTTVYGALYQLATMFTQTDLHGVDRPLARLEAVGHPLGVALLAGGRLLGVAAVATIGGLLVAGAAVAFAVVLARRLYEARVDRTPMLTRYAVLATALALWGPLAAAAWLRAPLARATLLGPPGGATLLVLGVVGFVVLGTLYHVVPFLVWVERYSDRLGLAEVPMIDDLYDDRIAAVDFASLLAGTVALVADGWVGVPGLATAGHGLLLAGGTLFVGNLLLVVRDHGPPDMPLSTADDGRAA